jgi:integrase
MSLNIRSFPDLEDSKPLRRKRQLKAPEHARARAVKTALAVRVRAAGATYPQAINYIVRVAGETGNLGRSGPTCSGTPCGYYLADKGTDLRTMQNYLGHRDPKHTAHYTRVAGHRLEGLWR